MIPCSSTGKESACKAGELDSIPGSGRSLKKENTAHSSILAWRISWTEDPGRLQPTGSQEPNTTERLNHHDHHPPLSKHQEPVMLQLSRGLDLPPSCSALTFMLRIKSQNKALGQAGLASPFQMSKETERGNMWPRTTWHQTTHPGQEFTASQIQDTCKYIIQSFNNH